MENFSGNDAFKNSTNLRGFVELFLRLLTTVFKFLFSQVEIHALDAHFILDVLSLYLTENLHILLDL